ncbi:biotin transporter BioY [Egicoccus sp. AB-alg2]|uniref:biotin transporter BioY n=1 Tax=Egicoccus sp. AB-alg2 TaxID=3242693 RepID=UPI00359EAD01
MSSAAYPHHRVLTDVLPGERVRDVVLSVGFAVAIAVSAQLFFYLPGNPVPVTGQTFAVLVGAIVLGRTRAAAGALLYLAVGAAGVPWFTAAGPHTLGYIVGFVVAAAVVGAMVRRLGSRTPLQVIGAMAVGNLLIWAFGAAGLALVLGLSATEAVATGVVPFLFGDAVKLLAAAAAVPAAWKLVDRVERR